MKSLPLISSLAVNMESSVLDYVAQACMDLSDSMNVAETDSERETLLTNHIKKVSSTVTTVDDFKNSKEFTFMLI